MIYSRARSIKTRIETKAAKAIPGSKWIREQDPLKQGLKQVWMKQTCDRGGNSRARSIKTRIETKFL